MAVASTLQACGGDAPGTGPDMVVVSLAPPTADLFVGESITLVATVTGAPGASLAFTSSAPDVVTVTGSGLVTAVGLGEAVVTVSVVGESASSTAHITVNPSSISLDRTSLTLEKDGTASLTATVTGGSDHTVTWSSADPTVATVDGAGLVRGVAVGATSVTAAVDGQPGVEATAELTVIPNVETVTVEPRTLELKTDESAQLTAIATDPDGAVIEGLTVVWSSDEPAVAMVSEEGLVTGVAVGTTAITASLDGYPGKEASVAVTVVPDIGSLEVAPAAFDLQLEESVQLTAIVKDPSGAVLEGVDVTWSTSDPLVATVTETGLVTGVGGGAVTVSAAVAGFASESAGVVQSFRAVADLAVIDSTVMRLVSDEAELDAGTYRFEVIGAPVPDLQPGQVLVGDQGFGFLRRVTAVDAGGGSVVVSTSPAGLEELFEEGELGLEFDILTGDLELPAGMRAARFPGPTGMEPPRIRVGPLIEMDVAPGVHLQGSSLDLSGFDVCKFFKNRGQPCPSIIDEFKLPTARADLTTSFDIGAGWTRGALDEFHAIASGTLDTDVDVSLGAKVAASIKREATIVQVGRLVHIQLGWLPVVILVELEMKGKFEANATVKGKLQAGLATNHTVEVGARWTEPGGWDGVLNGSGGFTVKQPSVSDTTAVASIQLDAKVSLTPELHLYFYGIVGPFLGAGPFEAAKFLASTQECYAELSAGVEGTVGVSANDFLGANKLLPPYSKKKTFGNASQRWDCPVGNIRVSTATSGSDLDPDGYTVTVDGRVKGGLGANDQVIFGDIPSGRRQVALTGVASNCTVTSANPQSVEVTVNSTAEAAFQIECQPVEAPDRIIFTDAAAADIWSMNPDGTDLVNITHNGAGNDDPSYSPDRSMIAYAGQTGSAWNLFVRKTDGTGTATQLTFAGSGYHADAEFSPDGSKISFLRDGDIYVMPASGGGATVVANDPKFDANAEWHPGGGTLVFESNKDAVNGHEIYTVPATGGAYSRLTDVPGLDADPTYSPDGSKILFRSDRNGPTEVWLMDASGGGQHRLTAGEEPTWSPDGTKIAFVRNGIIWTANADGSNAVSTGVAGSEPCWR